MIKERYVSFEVASLLRDKGFNEECTKTYNISNGQMYIGGETCNSEFTDIEEIVTAPTQQMACDWVEEKYNISIEVWVGIIGYGVSISYALKDSNIASNDVNHKDDMPCGDNSDGSWSSKELVYNAALKYVLTNLV